MEAYPIFYKENNTRNNQKLIPIPAGWRRLKLGEVIPDINKWQFKDEWIDGARNLGSIKRINRGFVRYIVPIK